MWGAQFHHPHSKCHHFIIMSSNRWNTHALRQQHACASVRNFSDHPSTRSSCDLDFGSGGAQWNISVPLLVKLKRGCGERTLQGTNCWSNGCRGAWPCWGSGTAPTGCQLLENSERLTASPTACRGKQNSHEISGENTASIQRKTELRANPSKLTAGLGW